MAPMLAAATRLTRYPADLGVSELRGVAAWGVGAQALTAPNSVRIMFCRTDMPDPGSGNQKDAVTLLGLRASTTRLICFAVATLALANLRIPGRPATLCPLRAITGVPCPFCGGTTAAAHLGHLDLLGALRVNPLVVVGAAVVVATPATIRVLAARHVEWLVRPTGRTVSLAIGLALVFSECWQLIRFGII